MKSILDHSNLFRMIGLLMLVAVCGMTSCAAPSLSTAVNVPTSLSQTEPTVIESTPTQVLALPTSTRTPLPIVAQPTSTVDNLAYDADANVLLLLAQRIGLPTPPVHQCYILPDLRVWGDGRVVRVMRKGDTREVAVGYLSLDRVAQMLTFLKEQGALSPWPREMPNPAGSGFSFKVQLKAGAIENWSNAVPAFFPKLLDFLNVDVKPLVPQQAFLIATDGSTSSDKVQEWPARFNVSLAQAMEQGVWVSGDALNFLWADANNGLSLHTFRQNGKMYAVALEIAGVGPKEPPEHCWGEWNKLLPHVEEITLDQARQIPGFHLLEPRYLPAGLRLQRVIHTTTIFKTWDPTNYNLPPVTRYLDDISLAYSGPAATGRTGSQDFIIIGERHYPDMPLPPGVPPPPATPDLQPEIATIRNTRAVVNRYAAISPPAWVTPEPGTRGYISLEWHEPDYYYMVGGSVSLDELIKFANSL